MTLTATEGGGVKEEEPLVIFNVSERDRQPSNTVSLHS